MELFSNNEIFLMIGVVGVLLLSILVLALFDYIDRRKQKEKIVVADDSVEFGEKMEEIELDSPKEEEMVEVLELEDEVMISDIKKEEVEAEFVPIKKEEQHVLMEEESVDLNQEINKALETVVKEDAIESYEMEQERTAIISLDELMQKSEDLYNSNEITQYDEGNEPISIEEVMSRYNGNEEKSVPEIMQNIVEDSNSMTFENTATYEKLSRENRNNFVAKLREAKENK